MSQSFNRIRFKILAPIIQTWFKSLGPKIWINKIKLLMNNPYYKDHGSMVQAMELALTECLGIHIPTTWLKSLMNHKSIITRFTNQDHNI